MIISEDSKDVYNKLPIKIEDGIPIFSEHSFYTENYEKIAFDLLLNIEQKGENPFIPEEIWKNLELPTVEALRKYQFPDAKVLDVGVGLGRVLSNFPDLQRYGIDISLNMLKIAKTKDINVCYAMIEDIPFKKNIFDIVICTDVLEHVLDLNLCCKKILSVLKPDGILIVRVPYKEDLSGYLSDTYPYKYVHLRNFDENSLRLLFEKIYNCKILDISYAGQKPYGYRYNNLIKVTNKTRLNLFLGGLFIALFSVWSEKYRITHFENIILKSNIQELIFIMLESIYYYRNKSIIHMIIVEKLKNRRPDMYSAFKDEYFNPIDINIVLQK